MEKYNPEIDMEHTDGMTVRINGREFFFSPETTALCTYDNDLADHLLHIYGEDAERTAFVSRHDSDGLWELCKKREFQEMHREEHEEYVEKYLGKIVVWSLTQYLREKAE